MNATQENWRPAVGYEGLYEVSDQGRVRSLDRWYKQSSVQVLRRGHELSVRVARNGNRTVYLKDHAGKTRGKYLHVLVLETFVGHCPEYMRAFHKDGDRTNNGVANLRWGSRLAGRLCQIPGCSRKHLAQGMCRTHYQCRYCKGVPLDRYMAMFTNQNGACAICNKQDDNLYLDHDHSCCPPGNYTCGECARGLLCPSCNTKMAAIDDPVFMRGVQRYLGMKRIPKLIIDEAASL